MLFQLLHSNVDHIDRKQANNVQLGGSLVIKCKDLRILQLDLNTLEDFTNVAVTLERLINIEESTKLCPFFYRPMYNIIEDGWTAFRPETEFNKLVTTCGDEWRISYVNHDFRVSLNDNAKNCIICLFIFYVWIFVSGLSILSKCCCSSKIN